ncbi:MAG: hypothetical protein CME64_17050 [Halobacteriovoraceae bacterium]|nr:hypothetical protein [Halobacteriovoraceae bacterium]|tara:strand:- start:235330 stop:236019 length:690 start_codon:yes stop_codon:yes gene_type:complete
MAKILTQGGIWPRIGGMSLIVSFQGQFRPYNLPPSAPLLKTQAASPTEPTHARTEEEEFQNALSESKEKGSNQPPRQTPKGSAAITAYKRSRELQSPPSSLACARDVMTCSVHTAKASDPVESAWRKMQKNESRHLPVVNDNGLITGIVSDRDLLKAGEKSNSPLSKIMVKEVLSARDTAPLKEMALVMLHERISCLPILNDLNELVGIVTKTDILRYLAQSQHLNGYI